MPKISATHRRKMLRGQRKYYRQLAEERKHGNAEELVTAHLAGFCEGIIHVHAANVGVPAGTLAKRIGAILQYKTRR